MRDVVMARHTLKCSFFLYQAGRKCIYSIWLNDYNLRRKNILAKERVIVCDEINYSLINKFKIEQIVKTRKKLSKKRKQIIKTTAV